MALPAIIRLFTSFVANRAAAGGEPARSDVNAAVSNRRSHPKPTDDEARVAELLARIDGLAGSSREAGTLVRIWSSRGEDDPVWSQNVVLYRRLARRCLEIGAPNVACEIAEAGRAVSARGADGREWHPWDADVTLRKVQGVALARSGQRESAAAILEMLAEEGNLDEETLGTLAGVRKDVALSARDPDRTKLLDLAIAAYRDAQARSGGTWTGINVASLLILRGEVEAAREVARGVRTRCLTDLPGLEARGGDTYWILATLGEASLVLGDRAEAEECYRRAYRKSGRRYGDLLETNRQAKLLVTHLGGEASAVDRWLPLPRVVVFTGHMIDRIGRPRARFPASRAEQVKRTLRQWLAGQGEIIGFSSAASGADILFQEAVHELGGDTYVVLPYEEESFRRASVEPADEHRAAGPSWGRRFEEVVGRATRVVMASSEKMRSDGVSFTYANLILQGLAQIKARELGTGVIGLAVWDGRVGDGHGGTASAVSQWRRGGIPVHWIDPAASEAGSADALLPVEPVTEIVGMPTLTSDADNRLVAMLFADAVGFSTLSESQVPLFVRECLGPIGNLLRDRYADDVIIRNTWGDGLYVVFTSVDAAGRFALDLADLFITTDWSKLGLPAGLAIRIALHAGPVYQCEDPVTGQPACTGTHVSRAARLEPRTPPGRVYASEGFAALAALEGGRDFTCEYVKQLSWAKHYGTFPTYLVRRRPR